MVAQNPLTPDRIDELGAGLYQSWSTPECIARERGRFIVFDVVSRDCEIANSDLEATDRLAERHPDGVFWGTRVGSDVAYLLRMMRRNQ